VIDIGCVIVHNHESVPGTNTCLISGTRPQVVAQVLSRFHSLVGQKCKMVLRQFDQAMMHQYQKMQQEIQRRRETIEETFLQVRSSPALTPLPMTETIRLITQTPTLKERVARISEMYQQL
jgi:hypothetical protein